MPEKKEKLTFPEIIVETDKEKNPKDKSNYLKQFLEDKEYKDIRRDLVKAIVPTLINKENAAVEYRLTYDSLNEGLEPIYFWLLDFMRDTGPGGLGLDVTKGSELFEASVSSGYFGEIGQRATLMQQKAMEYMGTKNNILKSIINLIYDLKEFEIRIRSYDELKNTNPEVRDGGTKSLKGIWMDQVDARKGRGSINLLTQDLQFITLRDAFFHIEKVEQINKDLDLNERVKNILKRKLEEYNAWVEYSEKEIRKRYNLEKIYLRSQAGTLKLYANWVKPYLISAQQLKMRNTDQKSLLNPNIVNAFSNMEIEIKLYGKKEIAPGAVHESYKNIQLDKKYYAVVEVTTLFRSLPTAISGQGGRQYVHGGRTDMIIRAFTFDDTEISAIDSYEMYEDLDLIENYIGMSLELLQKEIDEYLKPEVPKKEEFGRPKSQNPFKGVLTGFKDLVRPIPLSLPKRKGSSDFLYKEIEAKAKESAEKTASILYNVYKKTHGMIAV